MGSQSDSDFVIRELSKSRRRDEIIKSLCERSGFSWNEANRFIMQVEEEHQQTIRRPLNVIFFGAFVVAGILLVIIAIYITELPKAIASYNWATVHGSIVTSELTYGFEGDPSPRLIYSYRANGEVENSKKIGFFFPNCFVSSVNGIPTDCTRELLRKYPAGEGVSVYYDPDNSKFSVLEPGITLFAGAVLVILLFVAVVLIGIGVQGILRNPVY